MIDDSKNGKESYEELRDLLDKAYIEAKKNALTEEENKKAEERYSARLQELNERFGRGGDSLEM